MKTIWMPVLEAARVFNVTHSSIYRAIHEDRLVFQNRKVRAADVSELIDFGVLKEVDK